MESAAIVGFLATLLIALVLNIVAYVLMPKPKTPKPEAAKQMEEPIAEAGRERPVVFGTITVKEPNCLWSGDKAMREYEVKA